MQLDDLNKKNIYKVPERYFDELPGKIQRRIEGDKVRRTDINWALLLKISAPAVATLVIFLVWFNFQGPLNTSQRAGYLELLEDVSSENMVSYLHLQGISSEEILENIDVQYLENDFENYDNELFIEEDLNDETIDAILREYAPGV